MLADKGYDSNKIIGQALAQSMEPVIPARKNRIVKREYDKELYELRHKVENAFLHLKRWRGIATLAMPKIGNHSWPPYKYGVLHCGLALVTTLSRESVVRQVKIALHGLAPHQAAQVIIAYEPVWAIGVTGTAAREAETEAVCAHIRAALRELYGAAQALGMAVLYGGSVDRDNANAFLKQANINGLFVGRGAQNATDFLALLHMAQDTTTAL